MRASRAARPRGRTALLAPSVLVALACAEGASSLPEWTPADHDHQGAPERGQVVGRTAAEERAEKAARGLDGVSDVVIATWRGQCVRCHGVIGMGDGPDGRALRPRDLTEPAWQAAVGDGAIAQVIREGRGAMPAFALPPETVTGLVRLIRLLDRSRSLDATPAASAGPGPSAAPATPASASAAPR